MGLSAIARLEERPADGRGGQHTLPSNTLFHFEMESPKSNTAGSHLDNASRSAGLGVKLGMMEEAANETCHFILAHRQTNQAVPGMTKMWTVKPKVAREECRLFHAVKKREDFLVLHAGVPDFNADLAHREPPASQKLALIFRDIFVKDDHRVGAASSSR